MKKVEILLVCLLMAVAVQAQSSAKAKARVAEIRKAYTEAKEAAALSDREDNPGRSVMETKVYRMIPACGPQTKVIRYYFTEVEGEDGEREGFAPYLFTVSYNVAARKFYEEYLVDEKTGELAFAYFFNEEYDGPSSETRYYYNQAGDELLAHKTVKGEPLMDEIFAQRLYGVLMNAFHSILHEDY